jgi:hypothetical protein
VTILDRNRISIKENTTTRVSSLSDRKQIHSEARNKRNIRNREGGVERVPQLVTGREVSSAVRTKRGKSREQREDNAEESEVIWKEAPESKTHKEVPDCGDGGHSVWEIAVTEPAVSVEEEEPEVANMHLSVTISCAERDEPEEGGRVPLEKARPISSIFL